MKQYRIIEYRHHHFHHTNYLWYRVEEKRTAFFGWFQWWVIVSDNHWSAEDAEKSIVEDHRIGRLVKEFTR